MNQIKPFYILMLLFMLASQSKYAFSKDVVDFGIYSGLYSRSMGGKINFGIKSGFEILVMKHFLILPQINFNLSNTASPYTEEKFTFLEIDDLTVTIPRFEFGLCLGYKYRFAQHLSPCITVGLTYGKYETPHSPAYDIYGNTDSEYWSESRLLGIPVVIGNYFEITNRLSIKCDIQATHFTVTSVFDNEELKAVHRAISIGAGLSIVYFIEKRINN
jgi:hypothetical protein